MGCFTTSTTESGENCHCDLLKVPVLVTSCWIGNAKHVASPENVLEFRGLFWALGFPPHGTDPAQGGSRDLSDARLFAI